MKLSNLRYSILSVLLLFLSNQLSAQKNLLEVIPADAIFIGSIHANDLDAKVSWEAIRKYQVIEEMARQTAGSLKAEDSEMIRAALIEPKKYGIDLSGRSYVFSNIYSDELYVSFAFQIKEPKKFRDLVKAYYGNEIMTKIQKNLHHLAIYEDQFSICWHKNHAIFTFFDAKRQYAEEDFDFNARKKTALQNYVSRITRLKPEEAISSQESFVKWDEEVRDAGIWLDYSQMTQMMMDGMGQMAPYYRMKAIDEMLALAQRFLGNDEMYIASDISFEKGAILADTRTFAGATAMKYAASATSGKSNKRILNYLDGDNAIFYVTNHLSPKGTYEGLKEIAIDKAGEIAPDIQKITENLFGILEIVIDEDDAFSLLTGDLMFAINGVKIIEEEYSDYVYDESIDDYKEEKTVFKSPVPIFTFGLSYGNKNDMLKFIEIFETLGLLEKIDSKTYQTSRGRFTNYVKLDKNLLIISNDSARLVGKKKYAKMDKAHKDYLNENMQTVYFNMENLVKAIEKSEMEEIPQEMEGYLKDVKNGAGNIILQTKRPAETDAYILQSFKLSLKNKEENAVKSFFDFINRIYLDQQTGI